MKKIFLIVLLTGFAFCASAYSPDNDENIRFGKPSSKGRLLKKSGFVVMYDGVRKNPVWVSYHLKDENIVKGKVKPGAFRPDDSLPAAQKTAREDYPASYDKCPMAPVRDMAYSAKTYSESFLLSNTCPMDRWLKRTVWTQLEEQVRAFAGKVGDEWVITGPVFDSAVKRPVKIGKAKLTVPSGFYKVLLYQTKDGSFHTAAFYLENKRPEKKIHEYLVSVEEVEKKTGLNFFNVLPVEVQDLLEKTVYSGEFF